MTLSRRTFIKSIGILAAGAVATIKFGPNEYGRGVEFATEQQFFDQGGYDAVYGIAHDSILLGGLRNKTWEIRRSTKPGPVKFVWHTGSKKRFAPGGVDEEYSIIDHTFTI